MSKTFLKSHSGTNKQNLKAINLYRIFAYQQYN